MIDNFKKNAKNAVQNQTIYQMNGSITFKLASQLLLELLQLQLLLL